MSFYSTRNAESVICPGRVSGDAMQGLCERVCIEVKKIYDACMQQEQLNDVRVYLGTICPVNESPQPPLNFISCRSVGIHGHLREVDICRLCDRENFARVRAIVDIPVEVVFTDDTGREFTGSACISVRKDVILYVPCESIIPYELSALVSAVCVNGEYAGDRAFDIHVCVTVILKVVAEVNLLVPSYGFCRVPPCEEFAENVCDEFFGLPIFPPILDNCDCPCTQAMPQLPGTSCSCNNR